VKELTDDNATILLIDDSTDMHRLLTVRLRAENLQIIGADNGIDGVGLARSKLPDLILLDIDMPGMDGFEVLQALRDDEATHNIPVIFLSAMSTSDDKVRAFEMGAMDYVSKPPDWAELRARVRSALRISLLMKMLAQKAQIDGLTGLWNRTYLDTRLSEEFAQATRYHHPLSLILADLDRFKQVNDNYGHPHGDQVLQTFATLLTRGCREGDVAFRYGGEEFAVILPETPLNAAVEVAERVRAEFEAVVWKEHPDQPTTASFGVAGLRNLSNPAVERLLAAADNALYAAKKQGRNCVVAARNEGHRLSLSA
jgi:diguanylate cyclase (GGDEF)-like protein